ncbi:hypothetical protein ACSSS7_004674 [Eimeria intestinalis]
MGAVNPSLRRLSLTTRRGLTNAEMQQLCVQMPRLETLEIRILKSRSPAGDDPIEERRATHTIRRAGGAPWRIPKSIKRYLKLWTEVKSFSVTCEAATPAGGLPGGRGAPQLKFVSEAGARLALSLAEKPKASHS